jgi:hypothetical protein
MSTAARSPAGAPPTIVRRPRKASALATAENSWSGAMPKRTASFRARARSTSRTQSARSAHVRAGCWASVASRLRASGWSPKRTAGLRAVATSDERWESLVSSPSARLIAADEFQSWIRDRSASPTPTLLEVASAGGCAAAVASAWLRVSQVEHQAPRVDDGQDRHTALRAFPRPRTDRPPRQIASLSARS